VIGRELLSNTAPALLLTTGMKKIPIEGL
jgi:hypothetical protein